MNSYYSLLFLKEFTKELIKNTTPLYLNEKTKNEKKAFENIKEIIEENLKEDLNINQAIVPRIQVNKRRIPIVEEINKNVKETNESEENTNLNGMEMSILHGNQRKIEKNPEHFIRQKVQINSRQNEVNNTTPFMEITREQKEYPSEGLYVGELLSLINDQNVSSLECPGPNKFISVRVFGQTKLTKIQLDKEDINEIINSFSREARIPRIGGIFKAIINNLVLTAIDTEIAGPRFIITKIHPRQSEFL